MGGFGSPCIYIMNKNKKAVPHKKRDASADKKKVKKIFLVVACAFLVLGGLIGILSLVTEWISDDVETASYDDYRFYEPDYSNNILEDELYLSCNRGIHYNRYGNDTVLTAENIADLPESAAFFYNYFNNLIQGDYTNHSSFYTQAYLDIADDEKIFPIPEKFTMQGIYDIQVKLHKGVTNAEDSSQYSEIFEVSYRIFENNGTFRRDILPGETQTLVYELYISNGVVQINAIGYRTNAE